MKKKIANLFVAASIIILAWFMISYIEVIQNHYDPDYLYSKWNFFMLFINAG